MPKTGVKLTMAANIADRYDAAGMRMAEWLRETYPRHTIKLAAADLGVSPNTVKKWLAGVMPEGKHIFAMAAHWGRGFLHYVFEPAIGADDMTARHRELQEIKNRISRLEAMEELEAGHHGALGAPAGVGHCISGAAAGVASPQQGEAACGQGRMVGGQNPGARD